MQMTALTGKFSETKLWVYPVQRS